MYIAAPRYLRSDPVNSPLTRIEATHRRCSAVKNMREFSQIVGGDACVRACVRVQVKNQENDLTCPGQHTVSDSVSYMSFSKVQMPRWLILITHSGLYLYYYMIS